MPAGPQYLIQDPYHDYAIRFMETLRRNYGWRAVCMYMHPEGLRANARTYPELWSSDLVAASYRVSDAGIPRFVDYVRSAHDIRAVIPHYEPSVKPAAAIAAALGLSWAQSDVLQRFRDKRSLQAHLSRTDPDLRSNPGYLVASPGEALRVAGQHDLQRFVLKPNDGFGNVDVGFFSLASDEAAVARHWARAGSSQLLLEEFVDGEEYHCDGQTDAEGNVTVLAVGRYLRGRFNDKENIQLGWVQVPHDTETFRQVAEYTERVVRASGLRRTPFHAEVKIDDRGPCLIECAARVIGAGSAWLVNWAHGGSLDLFDLAAHYYVTDQPYGPVGVDWPTYDSHLYGQVRGVAPRTERIYTLTGVRDVEQLAGFRGWLKKPEVGQRLHVTTDIFGSAYVAATHARTEADLDRIRQEIVALVRWNDEARRPASYARAAASLVARRGRRVPTGRELRMQRFTGEATSETGRQ